MPVFLLIVGILFITAAVRGTHKELFSTLKDDFTGPNNFIFWGLSLFAIGALGYNKSLRPLANAFLVLVIIVMLLSNRGFFQKFVDQIRQTQN